MQVQSVVAAPSQVEVEQNVARVPSWTLTIVVIAFLTSLAILVAGYHDGIEDDAIYLPAVKKLLNPALFPHDSEFFATQTKAFPLLRLVALSVRITHVRVAWVEFAWQALSIFVLLAACWYTAGVVFRELRDRIGAVALVSVLLTMPVAGTALYIADQHLHPRTLACAMIVFAVGAVLRKRLMTAMLCSVLALAIHPLMAAFGIAFLIVLAAPLERWMRPSLCGVMAALPIPVILNPSPAWKEAALTRSYFYLGQWTWYEWLGILGPLALMWWFSWVAEDMGLHKLALLCRRMSLYSVVLSLIGVAVSLPAQLRWLAPTQPMRHLQLVYLFMLLAGGGLISHYVLRNRLWRWLALFLPLCGGMAYAQHQLFTTSPHIDLPSDSDSNRWVRCFNWIRENTPQDAYFAVDPNYMSEQDEENIGFRAIAERSKLADYSKDAAVVAVAPDLARKWEEQVDAMQGYEKFTRDDFLRLKNEFGVDWALVEKDIPGLDCPYRQNGLAVCRIK